MGRLYTWKIDTRVPRGGGRAKSNQEDMGHPSKHGWLTSAQAGLGGFVQRGLGNALTVLVARTNALKRSYDKFK